MIPMTRSEHVQNVYSCSYMSLWTLRIFEYFSALVVTLLAGFSGFTVRTVLFLSTIAHSLRYSYRSVWRTERNVRTYGLTIRDLKQ